MAEQRVTLESLRLYVPLFQDGEAAGEALDGNEVSEKVDLAERSRLLSQRGLKKLAFDELTALTYPLMRKEIQMAIRNSHLKREEQEIFPVIYYAGLGGMERGLRKFDVEKIEDSATNYLFQWIMVYAKKELLKQEAPMGVPPTRFQKHKKIAAVRKKLSGLLERPATNDEILEYFHTGRADFKNYNGPKIKTPGVSDANKKITMELILEQEELEKNLNFAQIVDSSEDYRSERLLSTTDEIPFEETLMGSFLSKRSFDSLAVAVLKSELQQNTNSEEDKLLAGLASTKYQTTMRIWKEYLSDPQGDFRKFLQSDESQGFSDLDISSMLNAFGQVSRTRRSSQPARYSVLFRS